MKQREFTEEFKRETVRIFFTSGQGVVAVANDVSIGKSMLDRCWRLFQEKDWLAGQHADVSLELARLRR